MLTAVTVVMTRPHGGMTGCWARAVGLTPCRYVADEPGDDSAGAMLSGDR